MAGTAYKDIHDILKHALGDILPDGQIIHMAQRICSSAGALAQIGVLDEFQNLYLYETRDKCINRIQRIFNSETKLEDEPLAVDSRNTEGETS